MADEQTKAVKNAAGKKGEKIAVRAAGEKDRRRAGMGFSKEPTEVDLSTITQDQYDAIIADPMLSVLQVKASA